MLSLNSNTLASSIAVNLNNNAKQLQNIAAQISSGKRIQSAADDPAGVGILSSLKVQSSGLGAVLKNISSGTSLLDISDKALATQQTIIAQMKDLAVQGSSKILSVDQRAALQSSFVEMQKQLDSTANGATLFGTNLLNAAATATSIQVGTKSGDTYAISAAKSDAVTLGVDAATIDLTDITKSAAALTALDAASTTVGNNQSTIGTQITGLNRTNENIKSTISAVNTSISRIEDADVAELSGQLTLLQGKQQLLSSTLGIVNQFPQYLLSLIR
jgi:flagellin